jgi:hypothetical protein
MFWNKSLSELQFHLAHLFPLKEDILHIAGKAGLPLANLAVADKGIVFWYNVLSEARQHGLLDEIITEARRLYPQDELLSSFNAFLIDKDKEVRLEMLKDLCADIIREGQFRGAIPVLEEILAKSPTGSGLEEALVVRFAETYRHQKDAEQLTGRKRTKSLRFLEASKSDLIALIQAV